MQEHVYMFVGIGWFVVLPPIGQYTLETAKRPMIYAIFHTLSGIAPAHLPNPHLSLLILLLHPHPPNSYTVFVSVCVCV